MMFNFTIGVLLGALVIAIAFAIFISRLDKEDKIKMSKKKQTIENKKDIKRLETHFNDVLEELGIRLWQPSPSPWTPYIHWEDDSPIKILEKKTDLILEHLGLGYKPKKEQLCSTKAKLYKKSQRKK